MTNEQWLELFKKIGTKMRGGLSVFLAQEGGKVPLGKGAGGDKTFPVDKWAEDIVIAALEKAHRQGESFTLISEELGVRKFGDGKKIVLVDPIDGSNNAKSGIPFFSTSLALLHGDTLSTLAVGYVINLAVGDEFWAVRGQRRVQERQADHDLCRAGHHHRCLSKLRSPKPTSRASCRSSARRSARGASDRRPSTSPTLLRARISVFATATASRAFDYAAGMLILEEADGVITDLEGTSLDHIVVGLERTVPLLASKNDATHVLALNTLARAEAVSR